MSKPAEDERLKKVGTLAATYSWLVTIVSMCFLMGTGYWNGRVFAQEELFGLVMVVMVVSLLGFNVFFRSMGDVK
jgi:Ni,Fe-hydrogenase I cytochrome b subunit